MLRNALGEPVLQPGDDIEAAFGDLYCTGSSTYSAWFLACLDQGGWGCEVRDEDENILLAQDFSTQQELISWLTGQGVEIIQ